MPPTFALLVLGLLFVALCIPCVLVWAFGKSTKLNALMRTGRFGLYVCAGFIGMIVLGTCHIAVVDCVTTLWGPRTRTQPNRANLVGTYALTSDSAKFVRHQGYATSSSIDILLSADGTFEMNNMPDMWHNFGQPGGCFDSGSGTWELDSRDAGLATTFWGITLDFDDVQGFHSSVNKNGFAYLNVLRLKNQQPPYRFEVIMGDADEGQTLEFERLTTPPSAGTP